MTLANLRKRTNNEDEGFLTRWNCQAKEAGILLTVLEMFWRLAFAPFLALPGETFSPKLYS